ncbi:GNAT family N-acetyltransferase [Exiguobacterium sp. RIT341]|uniref:GNAT family N-acetyltransferase n=1 Tax=Exiguobacterium sp. RIT341 TaxID=1470592 RepID=UPI00044B0C16|nr:GNAT family N-acetyltransferase [Exiguobacterium sp. RIT341]EZP61170.1 GCN5 family acetyltransferase [Exiguobacterium sp. RIT341]
MTEQIRRFQPEDFDQIHRLNELEGWQDLVADQERTREAWISANAAYVLEYDGQVVAYVRALTDGFVTTYVCELLVSREARKQGYGQQLLDHLQHTYPTRIDLLATRQSAPFYEEQGFRAFHGFRKSR